MKMSKAVTLGLLLASLTSCSDSPKQSARRCDPSRDANCPTSGGGASYSYGGDSSGGGSHTGYYPYYAGSPSSSASSSVAAGVLNRGGVTIAPSTAVSPAVARGGFGTTAVGVVGG